MSCWKFHPLKQSILAFGILFIIAGIINLIVGGIIIFGIIALLSFAAGSGAEPFFVWAIVIGLAVALLAIGCITTGSIGVCAAQRETKKMAFAFFISTIVLVVICLTASIAFFTTYGKYEAYGGIWWIVDLIIAGVVAFLAWKYWDMLKRGHSSDTHETIVVVQQAAPQ